MARILALIMMCFITLSMTAGTAAHAAEPLIICLDADTASDPGHMAEEADQLPDDGKARPHQHGGCHGHHQVAEPAGNGVGKSWSTDDIPSLMARADNLASADPDPALRPPIA